MTDIDNAVAASTTDTVIDPQGIRDAATRQILNALSGGQSVEAAIGAAVQLGIDEPTARGIATGLKGQIVKMKKDRALRGMGIGALWFFGGLAVTAGSYFMAAPGSGYLITWGAVIFGGLRIVTNGFSYLNAGK